MGARHLTKEFFLNERLAEVSTIGRLFFMGLCALADREGRLEDRPRRLKKELLPYVEADGDALIATHYCAQGNQVRLRVSAVSPGRVAFTYLDATNVDPNQSVMHELVFVLGPGTLERTEVYQAHDGARDTSVLRFVRR